MSRARVVGATGSLALHALLLLALIDVTATGDKPAAGGHTQWTAEDAVKLRGAGPQLVDVKPLASSTAITAGDADCADKSYTGIGILVSPDGRVIDVGPHTPAERAGLRDGDTVLNLDIFKDTYAPGGEILRLQVVHLGEPRELDVMVGKICQD